MYIKVDIKTLWSITLSAALPACKGREHAVVTRVTFTVKVAILFFRI